MRPIYWSHTKNQCDDLKHDGTADGSIAQCEYNCQWDLTCKIYQYYSNDKCYRGSSDDCNRHEVRVVSGGKKDYKFMFKTLKNQCSGLTLDRHATSFQDCKGNCKSDDDCSVWQFYLNGQCWRGHPTTCTAKQDARVVKGGYRWYINNGDNEEDEDVEADRADREVESDVQCPQGYWALGWDGHLKGADHRGCGIKGCDDSHSQDFHTPEACATRCDDVKDCVAFSFAPAGGDKNHGDNTVCYLYDDQDSTPNQRWPGVNGDYSQVFCKSTDKSRQSFLSGQREANGRKGHTCGYLTDFVHVPRDFKNHGHDQRTHQTHGHTQDCADICQNEYGCVGFEYNFDGHHDHDCHTYHGVAESDIIDDDKEDDGWISCVPAQPKEALPEFTLTSHWKDGVAADCHNLGCQTVDSASTCANICFGDQDCNVFNYCPKGADCTSGEGRCCSRKCHSTSKHDLELTHHWKGWDVYTRNDGRRNLIDRRALQKGASRRLFQLLSDVQAF